MSIEKEWQDFRRKFDRWRRQNDRTLALHTEKHKSIGRQHQQMWQAHQQTQERKKRWQTLRIWLIRAIAGGVLAAVGSEVWVDIVRPILVDWWNAL